MTDITTKPPHLDKKRRCAIVIPVYNHGATIAKVVKDSLKLGIPVIVVDDGSTDLTHEKVKQIKGAKIIRHRQNQGKGAALLTGFFAASKLGCWAITIDADGQHCVEDALKLIDGISNLQRPIVVGTRKEMLCAGAPWTSRMGRIFSNFWVTLAGGPKMSDSQSGFRAYPLPEILNIDVRSRRFQFEVEIIVLAKRAGIPIIEIPITVNYPSPDKRVSHFRPFIDFLRNSQTFTRLIVENILAFLKK